MKTSKIAMNNSPDQPAAHRPQLKRSMTEGHCSKNLTGSLLPQYDEYGCLLLSLRWLNHPISLLPSQKTRELCWLLDHISRLTCLSVRLAEVCGA